MKYLLIGLVSIVCTTAMAQTSTGFLIKGKVKGMKDTTSILAHYICFPGEVKQVPKDTAHIDSNGNFTFQGKEQLPSGMYLMILPQKGYMELIITDQEQSFSFETDTTNLIKYMRITGSKENDAHYSYMQMLDQKREEVKPLQEKYKANPKDTEARKALEMFGLAVEAQVKKYFDDRKGTAFYTFMKGAFDPEVPKETPTLPNGRKDSTFAFRYYKAHYFDNLDLSDIRFTRTPYLQRKLETYLNNLAYPDVDSLNREADYLVSLAKNNQDMKKYLIWYLASTYEVPKSNMANQGVFVHVVDKYYVGEPSLWDTSSVSTLKKRADILRPLQVGKVLPNYYPSDTLNKLTPLHSINAKYLVVFFYDPECSHCRETTPHLVKLYSKLKAKGATVLMAAIGYDLEKWKNFIHEFKTQKFLNVINVHINDKKQPEIYQSHEDFQKTFDVFATPMVYILDRDKKIIAKRLPLENFEDFLSFYDKKMERETKAKPNMPKASSGSK